MQFCQETEDEEYRKEMDDREREAVKDMEISRVQDIHVISMGSSAAKEKPKLQYLYPRESVP